MAKSTLVAIMGRMAGYTGQAITWDTAFGGGLGLVAASGMPLSLAI